MVDQSVEDLDSVFYALADPTRRSIISALSRGEATVKEIAEPYPMSLPAVSKHLKVLERAGLIERQIEGRTHRIRIRPTGMRSAAEWMERYREFWEGQLDRLEAFLDSAIDSQDDTGEESGS